MRTAVAVLIGLSAQGVNAEESADCAAVATTLDRVVEVLETNSASRTVTRMGLVQILSRAGVASAYARDMDWPEDMAEALAALRDLPNPRDDGSLLSGEEARPLVIENALIVAAGMPERCPESEIPDMAPYTE